jgi:hypothetical protein
MIQNNNSNYDDRGLATADEKTTLRIASEGGKASHKNDDGD